MKITSKGIRIYIATESPEADLTRFQSNLCQAIRCVSGVYPEAAGVLAEILEATLLDEAQLKQVKTH